MEMYCLWYITILTYDATVVNSKKVFSECVKKVTNVATFIQVENLWLDPL